jgi:hypothetical protein
MPEKLGKEDLFWDEAIVLQIPLEFVKHARLFLCEHKWSSSRTYLRTNIVVDFRHKEAKELSLFSILSDFLSMTLMLLLRWMKMSKKKECPKEKE